MFKDLRVFPERRSNEHLPLLFECIWWCVDPVISRLIVYFSNISGKLLKARELSEIYFYFYTIVDAVIVIYFILWYRPYDVVRRLQLLFLNTCGQPAHLLRCNWINYLNMQIEWKHAYKDTISHRLSPLCHLLHLWSFSHHRYLITKCTEKKMVINRNWVSII